MEWRLGSDPALGRALAARLALAVAWATMLTACGVQTDGDQFYDIEFSNNTQTAVVLWNHHIDKADLARLQPGRSASILADINDSPEQIHVEDMHGHQLGCILISYKSKPHDARLLVSATRPCDP